MKTMIRILFILIIFTIACSENIQVEVDDNKRVNNIEPFKLLFEPANEAPSNAKTPTFTRFEFFLDKIFLLSTCPNFKCPIS